MSEPCKSVADYEECGEEIPLAARDEEDQQRDTNRGSDEVQKARERFTVLTHIERPEFGVAADHLYFPKSRVMGFPASGFCSL